MKNYESMFVLRPTLTEEEVKARVEAIKSLLEKNGATIALLKEYGARNLAYEIKKNKRGYFVDIFFQAPATTVKELERVYRITEDIIKFMTIKYESKKELKAWESGSKSGLTSIMTATQRKDRRERYSAPRDGRSDRPPRDSNRYDSSQNSESRGDRRDAQGESKE